MAKIVYKIQETGQAMDLRFVKDDYVAGEGEKIIKGDILPDILTLHTQVYISAKKLSDIRAKRNALLAECDWTQMLDAPLTPEQLAAWAEYRQELRDFPATCDVYNPVWPEKPA